ncbi:hypothetical protein QCA50_012564 [Cerrena zonata]|uniref:Uncharacterized protein n=1 Tax=Cerrena zonata TaxID=2478898 RepID=A0AAW0FSD4_9APHY
MIWYIFPTHKKEDNPSAYGRAILPPFHVRCQLPFMETTLWSFPMHPPAQPPTGRLALRIQSTSASSPTSSTCVPLLTDGEDVDTLDEGMAFPPRSKRGRYETMSDFSIRRSYEDAVRESKET